MTATFDLRVLDAIAKAAKAKRDSIVEQMVVGEPDYAMYMHDVGFVRALDSLFFDEDCEAARIRKIILEGN